MATPNQIRANRANALRSTGPKTPEGKKVCAQNSTRHGMLSQTVVLEGESQTRFEDLVICLTAQLKPRSLAEAAIVETMAIARWKQMRIWGIQKAGFDLEMARLNSTCNIPAARASMVFKNLAMDNFSRTRPAVSLRNRLRPPILPSLRLLPQAPRKTRHAARRHGARGHAILLCHRHLGTCRAHRSSRRSTRNAGGDSRPTPSQNRARPAAYPLRNHSNRSHCFRTTRFAKRTQFIASPPSLHRAHRAKSDWTILKSSFLFRCAKLLGHASLQSPVPGPIKVGSNRRLDKAKVVPALGDNHPLTLRLLKPGLY